ncbi:MAG: hypothetical protein KatS3mg131_1957 [Candidatus Tectimicrobiota bacterium]|nr:MAG: hypothetical protein KatS3mg131_1957 [Candidatus Tectomicrobia bacterium]
MQRLQAFAREQGWPDCDGVAEIGSGLNGKRKKLQRVLRAPKVNRIGWVSWGQRMQTGGDLARKGRGPLGRGRWALLDLMAKHGLPVLAQTPEALRRDVEALREVLEE